MIAQHASMLVLVRQGGLTSYLLARQVGGGERGVLEGETEQRNPVQPCVGSGAHDERQQRRNCLTLGPFKPLTRMLACF